MSHETELKRKQKDFNKTILPELLEDYCKQINLQFPADEDNELINVMRSPLPANELINLISARYNYQISQLDKKNERSPLAHLQAIEENINKYFQLLDRTQPFSSIPEVQHMLEVAFHMGYNVAANDMHVLIQDPAFKGSELTARCNTNIEKQSNKPIPVNRLIQEMYTSLYKSSEIESFKKEEAYHAIQNTIDDFLCLKKLPESVQNLFLPYGNHKVPSAPSIEKIRTQVLRLKITTSKKLQQCSSRSKLEKHLKNNFGKKQILSLINNNQ